MRRIWIVVLTGLLLGLPSEADPKQQNKTDSKSGYTVKAMMFSHHEGSHLAEGVYGKDWIVVLLKAKPSGQPGLVKGWFSTPFSDITTNVSASMAVGDNSWFHGRITSGRGKYKTWADGLLIGSGATTAAHDVAPARGTGYGVVAEEALDALDWGNGEGPEPLSRDLLEGGEPELDENDDVIWEESEPSWVVPPVSAPRLTSSVDYLGSGIVRYTYELENLTGTARDFDLLEITSPGFPSGWSGTVAAYDVQTTSLEAGGDLCVHNALGVFPGPGSSDEAMRTFVVYVPRNRLATAIECDITSAGYDGVQGANVIRFELTEPAEGALLYRVTNDEDETLTVVAEMSGPLAANTQLQFLDDTFPAGVNSYTVKAGTGVNGYRSAEANITNQ